MKAIIVVDMQNDFISGTLAVPGAQEIVGPMQDYLFDALENEDVPTSVVCTKDWHPKNHSSFVSNGGTWPMHCVQDTWGAELQVGLRAMRGHYTNTWPVLKKGENAGLEEYSGYTEAMQQYLAFMQPDLVEICGLARDYCVQATYDDIVKAGYNAVILESLCRRVRPY